MQVTEALVSGSLGQAIFLADGALSILDGPSAEPRRASPNEIGWFRHKARAVLFADLVGATVSIDDVRQHLNEQVRLFNGLDGLLIGMDRDFSESLRRRAISRAQQLLHQDDGLTRAIREHFWTPANAHEWDPAGGLQLALAEKAESVAACYRPLADGTIDRLADDIAVTVTARLGSDVEAFRQRELILRSGLLAELTLIESRGDRKALSALMFRRDHFPKLRTSDPSGQILAKIIHRVEERLLPANGELNPTQEVIKAELDELEKLASLDPIVAAIERALANYEKRRGKRQSGSAADVPGIQREIEWIGERLKLGQVTRAEQALLKLIDRQVQRSRAEDIVKTLTAVADLSRLARQYDWTWRILIALDHLGASDAASMNVRAQTLRELGRTDEALAVLEETMRRFPHNEVAPNAYAEALRELGRTDETLAVLKETMRRFPHDEVAPTAYAEALRELGRADEALAVLEETMRRFPHDEVARNVYAEALRELGRTDEVLAVLEETMRRFPHDEVARNAYAEALRELGRTDEALAVLEETMRRFPHDEVTRTSYAHMLIEYDRFAEAEPLLLPAATRRQSRNDWIALHVLAMAWLRNKRINDALDEFERGIELCKFADVRRYFVTARPLALLAARRAEEAARQLELLAKDKSLPREDSTNVALFRIHALAEAGYSNVAHGIINSAQIIDFAAAKQKRLAAILEKRYGIMSGVPAPASETEQLNEDIVRLELELVRPKLRNSIGRKAA